MSWLTRSLSSSSGRKLLAAVTGLGLVLFLIIHLLGNLQIFSNSDAFNHYAQSLHNGPLIVLADIGLPIMFVVHMSVVIWLALDNKKARGPVGYKVHGTKQTRGFAGVLASKSALYGGIVLIAFVLIHVWHMRLQHEEMNGLAREYVIDQLMNPGWGLLYIVGSLVTGWHLFHGIQAAFRSVGVNHPRYTPLIVKTGMGIATVLALGFAAIPVWILLNA
ncbi:MAG: succinate dehydrogenase cytochrome b subunit [Deltaproteobacteria bacterium]|nr:MAG: succinate dehydrogenase cytochrome b subunit [Deltaproteobacteria bacterium]